MEFVEPFIKVFLLVFLAEFGDKSQLVCMTLSARYRAAPVLIGSVLAFSVLNALAAIFGAALSIYVPQTLIFFVVGVLFFVFAIQSFKNDEEESEESIKIGKHLISSVFILIFLAELGDKTQLAIAGLAAVEQAWIVWVAGTVALMLTTLLGVWFGRVLLKRLPIALIHRGAGVLFMLFAGIAFFQLYQLVR
ncbi:TMEM165/GDT1 family protein [Neptuniibacter sp. 1_MG-2023]|uniref:TMEM165/GDT1 family protein n=1 Tax=Neptuniibacter sp. 1_MG-2023 TaxID=3062662 RepID=UPI0026E2B9D7|nr:TMEM165/GDT1 family protein [Neptuniibacter sp. 1_MG-2023]MDO6592947.1 TMEM165/GDT1 family protein [Neptuniibacter sp. 1_MG-2023]